MKVCNVLDKLALTERKINDQGFLVAPATLCRTGVQPYTRGELGLDGDPREIIRLMRTPEEVFSADAVRSFEDAPITDGHPPEVVTSDNWKKYAVGEVRDCKRVGDHMCGTTIVKDGDAIAKITRGKSALSNGYSFDLDLTPGEGFDGYQRNIRGNHVAIVDVARGGPACRIADEESTAGEGKKRMKTLVIDGIPLPFEDAQAAAVEKMQVQIAAHATEKTAFDGAMALLVLDGKKVTPAEIMAKIAADGVAIADLRRENTELKGKILTDAQVDEIAGKRAVELQSVIEAGQKLGVTVATDGKNATVLRREILTAAVAKDAAVKTVCDSVLGATGIDKADPAVLSTLLAAIASTRSTTTTSSQVLAAQDQAVGNAIAGNSNAVANDGSNGQPVGEILFGDEGHGL